MTVEFGAYLFALTVMLMVIAAGTALICQYFNAKSRYLKTTAFQTMEFLGKVGDALTKIVPKIKETRDGNKD